MCSSLFEALVQTVHSTVRPRSNQIEQRQRRNIKVAPTVVRASCKFIKLPFLDKYPIQTAAVAVAAVVVAAAGGGELCTRIT